MSEARRRLPELVRKVLGGHPPMTIGQRGHAEALLSRAPLTAPVRRPELGDVLEQLVDVDARRRELARRPGRGRVRRRRGTRP